MKDYLINVLIALDQLVNALFRGWPDETLSSRCYRLSGRYWYAAACRRILDFLFRPFGPEHCREAWESERTRKHINLPMEKTPDAGK